MTYYKNNTKKVVIIGAGPAGLAAGYKATQQKINTVIIEMGAQAGGLSRTICYKGNYFDIGGHRFFTKNKEVLSWWRELLRQDFLKVPRSSRIFYNGKYFDYPISVKNVIFGLGLGNAILILLSYIKARIFPSASEASLELWLTNRFGKRLYRIFFKNYSEKVWGMPCENISADWAAERIKGVSLSAAVRNALSGGRNNKVKSLISEFYFPRLGAGMMYEAAARKIIEQAGEIKFNNEVVKIKHAQKKIISLICRDSLTGSTFEVSGSDFCSSMPITSLVERMDPPAEKQVLEACNKLRYRSLVLVFLVIDTSDFCQDTWIYVHSPLVKAARIQNFRKWSQDMLADPKTSTIGVEYFCDEGDAFWRQSDEVLKDLAVSELEKVGLSRGKAVLDSLVVRIPKAYPVYERGYLQSLDVVKGFCCGFSNLQCMGRYGLFHYNGMDHSVLTGFLAAQNLVGEQKDLWNVNVEIWDD
jgi:protoporphyrinogen oxidase